jgi:DNA-binding TFAR19-related protein (PDSD5 family)
LEASELSLEKIKQAKLKTDQAALNVQAKIESAKKRNTQLTVEERVQNEVNNRLLKQEARERLGLVGTYEN